MPKKKIGTFSVEYLQILDENGNVDKKLEPKLSDKDLLKLYEYMFMSREYDHRMLKLQRQGRIGTIPLSIGQEAAFCSATLPMKDDDWWVGSYRELGARLMRGEPLVNTLLYYGGYEEGSFNPNNDRTLPIAVVLGSQLLHAVGLSYASRLKGEKDTASICFFGDGASSEGDVHEALNFASVWNTPTVFVCQNNQWAISTPRGIQTKAESIAQRAIGYGMKGIQVDGNDPLAVYSATKEAFDRARKGEGPTLIEAVTYRMMMHTTADDPTKYRDDSEVKEWEAKDPLIRMKKYLEDKGIWNEEKQEELAKDVKSRIEAAVKEFESREEFKPDAPFDYVYGTTHEIIEEQRERFLEDLRKDTENA